MKGSAAATVAAAAAVVLAAGMTSPASARPEQQATSAGTSTSTLSSPLTPSHEVALITGDRVTVDAKGNAVGVKKAKGRENIMFRVHKSKGHTLVVPSDAAGLLASGKVDQRLFDVTQLNKAATRTSQKRGLKVIVGYKGAATATKADVRDTGTLRRSLKSLNADAVQTPLQETPDLWAALTNGGKAASGIANVWLDGVRKVSLDKSVAQIGAPTAWSAGYDGTGVKIAVLDTGVDATHPDLKDKVIASKNFSSSPDVKDRGGHGTHVASTAAGTGAKSGGTYKGVAPGAKILDGKILDDEGVGEDSGILAGMEWAAAQGADIVNMSLGSEDFPGIDPVEAEVNKLSAEKGVLFAVAAGNSGPQTVGSPASADAALAVGAVDDNDKLADFSSTGPRLGDVGIKPDVTAPGVDITAASAKGSVIAQEMGEKPEGYTTISGTSMATPHVAGAAALLKQQHPNWGYAELKGALTGSAKGGNYTPFEQGSGRIQVDQAIKQTVIADPVSVSFGTQLWPHTDDTPVTKQLTYRNLGTADVTLSLAATTMDPKGQAAPEGFFKLAKTSVTVPAGGKASVDFTVDTRLGGTVDGAYSSYVTATGGGQTVRTAAAVQREVESYDVTFKFIGRDGKPAPYNQALLMGVGGLALEKEGAVSDVPAAGQVVRLPKGDYVLDSEIMVDREDAAKGLDWLVQPQLTVDKKQTVVLDARKAKPVNITVPDARAKPVSVSPWFTVKTPDRTYGFDLVLDSYENFRSAGIGPKMTRGSVFQQWDGHWISGAAAEYNTVDGARGKQLATGYTRHFKARDLATVKARMGAVPGGKVGTVRAEGQVGELNNQTSINEPQSIPGTRTLYLSALRDTKWTLVFTQRGVDSGGETTVREATYTTDRPERFAAGKTYTRTFNTAVFGPHLTKDYGLFREGDEIYGSLPLFADSSRNVGISNLTSVTTKLYRNGTKVASKEDPLLGDERYAVPAGDAAYKLTTSAKRSSKIAGGSTRIDASWTFRSKTAADKVQLPASTVRFNAKTALDSTVAAGRTTTVPLVVEGAAAGRNLKSQSVWTSYDGGKNWKKVKVTNGKISVKNPAKGKAISFRAEVTDKKGNKSTLSIYNAYYGK
ncbi:S8 family serine peptidase [Streptomyces sp. NBC_00878]|uniref:S8 family peptidase n=1 Tax=Streptomyces sp. NBC_00878 TaxID=2975854 RepID=UPI0022530A3F|nr:S8 family serine peptidase [Streptomyces sp. NBC_00878]MCX4907376.1 S8 family serine peptidase [Streptomyces sp. NBC_00878]